MNLRGCHAEGSNHEEFEAIRKRSESKTFNLKDPSDYMEFANAGRDFGLWATSLSTAAEAPTENIVFALSTVFVVVDTLSKFPLDENATKSMLRDIVWRLIDQFNANVKGASMSILSKYA